MENRPLKRSEKFAITLFGVMTAAIVLPGIVLIAVSLFNTGSIYLPKDFSF
jgi:hypothetical protein